MAIAATRNAIERRDDDRQDRRAQRVERREDRTVDRRFDRDDRRELRADRREVRVVNGFDRDVRRDDDRRFGEFDFGRRFARFDSDCPPGLAKKSNGCLPPGQAKKMVGRAIARRAWRRNCSMGRIANGIATTTAICIATTATISIASIARAG